ncbi:MAG TPA: plastocyanin/azurin family copper-binding protein [Gemmatimonadales bacterium]|nr:plastocyanin/azurin family copper-binding protein [Gemmatimonadales bacterium]
MRTRWKRDALAMAALFTLACNGNSDPTVSAPIIAKSGTKSGDAQSGPANQALPNELRVEVTRDGAPASGVTVTWSTGSGGTLTPTTDQTDADGLSTSVWTLGPTTGPQSATARVDGGGLNSTATFTATATTGTPGHVIQVISVDNDGGNRFVPTNLTVVVGTTVTWEWVDNLFAHNVVPDDASTPAQSGGLVSGPHTYEYTFNAIGTFQYHCQAHGSAGMVGTVTVIPAGPSN